MTTLTKAKKFIFFIIIPLCFAWVGIYQWLKHSNYIINITPSMPYGLYQITPIDQISRGDLVLVCLPKSIGNLALKSGYLNHSQRCKDGIEPVIKKVIGIEGDMITVDTHLTTVTHQETSEIYPAPLMTISSSGHVVPRTFNQSKIRLSKNKIWIYGSYDYNQSWDSRYFGPISSQHVIGKMKEIITF